MHGAGDVLEAEGHGAADGDGLLSDDVGEEVEPLEVGPVAGGLAVAGGVVGGFEGGDFGVGPVEDEWIGEVGVADGVRCEASLDCRHVGEPLVDDSPFLRLGEGVDGEGGESPFAVFDVATADDENEGLAAASGELGEVVGEVADGFEVDVELQWWFVMPLGAGGFDAGRADDWASGGAVGVHERHEFRGLLLAIDADDGGGAGGVSPVGDTGSVGLVAAGGADLPEEGEFAECFGDLLFGEVPGTVLDVGHVGVELGGGGARGEVPCRSFGTGVAEPLGGLLDGAGDGEATGEGAELGDGGEAFEAGGASEGFAFDALLP